MKGGRILVIVVGLLVVLGVLWFFSAFELVEDVRDTGKSPRAIRDPYLAAERLVTALGVPAEGLPSIARVPDPDHVVFLAGERAGFVGQRQRDLLNWVENGGHLILVLQGPDRDGPFGASGWMDEDEPVEDALLRRVQIQAFPVLSGDSETIRTEVPGVDRPVQVEVRRRARLEAPSPRLLIRDSAGNAVFVSVDRGLGRVTAMVDDHWMTNDEIGRHDHATLLWALVRETRPQGMWIVRGDRMPGLMQLLFDHAWPALLAFGALVLTWIVRAGFRFGPLLDDTAPPRRSLDEHLDAAGRFLWRCHAQQMLLQPLRERLVREVGRRRPAWAHLRDEDKIHNLAEASGLPAEHVRDALTSEQTFEAPDFVAAVRHLQQLESNL